MKIALIGATGYVGGVILTEILHRGHHITAIVRHVDKVPKLENVAGKKCDVMKTGNLAAIIKGHDAVISAFNPGWTNPDIYEHYLKGTISIIKAVKKSGVKRLLVVGGAGSLEVAPGKQLVDTPEFPKEYKLGALAAREALNLLRKEKDLEWTFVSPSTNLVPGERTKKYRLGTDQLLLDDKGTSSISVQDLAAAILDEIENPKYVRARFTVGY